MGTQDMGDTEDSRKGFEVGGVVFVKEARIFWS